MENGLEVELDDELSYSKYDCKINTLVYIAIRVNLDGRKDVLGMWVGENESAKFWLIVAA